MRKTLLGATCLLVLGWLLLAAAAGPPAPLATGSPPATLPPPSGYHVRAGQVHDPDGRPVQLRGINHFGFNAPILQPQFLWKMGWKAQITQIKTLGFNAVRLPFVPDTLHVTTPVDQLSWLDGPENQQLVGKTPLQVLDLWMAEADRQGLYVVLDFHSVSAQRQYPTWFVDTPADFGLMYHGRAYTEQDWIDDLVFVAARYAHLRRFIGIDLYNEPNGIVRWSAGDSSAADPRYHWKTAAEKAAAAVLTANPDLLVFVAGITGNWDGREDSTIPMNYGENLQPQAYQPLDIRGDKLVLSPHTYGPDVYGKSTFEASDYPANLAAHWEVLFGQFHPRHAVIIGEWGGHYGRGPGAGPGDVAWQDALVEYLQGKGIHSSFYWCYTPNSDDTGGILDAQLRVREDKMALLRRHWGAQ
ncbi:glycoside hydrolase family 5 protein [Luteimonas terrae]|uniref:cellulase n=1 Tax=Luteimonas terrae TaxID=1530191 RepID=A0ABU1XY77_9GAMM|nr:cellulase family glycosylhydrolase [Luteimonas terrae]MDR7193734.1 aryl-phospho-beta-D-glucosidase BglC (GH1 family) [Luteimonas terrae]